MCRIRGMVMRNCTTGVVMSRNLIILPVYNRADIIESKIQILEESLGSQTDILVVDDGSEDNTSEIIQPSERVKLLTHESSLGYGAAFAHGLQLARNLEYDYAVSLDILASRAHYAFTPIMKELAAGMDIVNCSRMTLADRGVADEDYSAIDTGSVVADMLNGATGFSLIDPFSPYKGFRVNALDILEITEYDEAAVIQLWIQSAFHGLKIKEILCEDIHTGYIHEGEYLEKDIDHYLDFIESEKYLFPVGGES
jgi:glycosyltransferase involved in cell wall biosynthesis